VSLFHSPALFTGSWSWCDLAADSLNQIFSENDLVEFAPLALGFPWFYTGVAYGKSCAKPES
jgi:hypothetical protein